MPTPKHLTLSFYIAKNRKRVITPVTLYSVPFDSSLSLTTEALWDTGASMSAITPEIQKQLRAVPIDRKEIAGVHNTEEVDIVSLTLELPNNVVKKTIRVAVCNITSKVGVILGMDIISLGDFALSNGSEQTLLSFAVPPFQEKIDFSKKQYDP